MSAIRSTWCTPEESPGFQPHSGDKRDCVHPLLKPHQQLLAEYRLYYRFLPISQVLPLTPLHPCHTGSVLPKPSSRRGCLFYSVLFLHPANRAQLKYQFIEGAAEDTGPLAAALQHPVLSDSDHTVFLQAVEAFLVTDDSWEGWMDPCQPSSLL